MSNSTQHQYFVSAIGTDSGKTVVSAIICQALHADYWKPIQCGTPDDTNTVKTLVSNDATVFHPEKYFLKMPASPHAASKAEGIEIELKSMNLPATSNTIIIEGAGGLMVPLNDSDNVMDMIPRFGAEVVLVSNYYLGSINHSLLSIAVLKKQGIKVKGIIFNGEKNEESKRIILKRSGYRCLLELPTLADVNKETIQKYANELKNKWYE